MNTRIYSHGRNNKGFKMIIEILKLWLELCEQIGIVDALLVDFEVEKQHQLIGGSSMPCKG
jgi:hypothetical protein